MTLNKTVEVVDLKYNSAIHEAVLGIIEGEKDRFKPSENYIKHLPPANTTVFETELMRSEFDRIQQCFPIETMNMECFEIPQSPIVQCIDVSAWQEKLENLNSQLEHHATKIRNLKYIKYGAETWKTYAEILLKLIDGIKAQVTDLKKQIHEVNTQQMDIQQKWDEKSRNIQTDCMELASENYKIRLASKRAEEEMIMYKLAKFK